MLSILGMIILIIILFIIILLLLGIKISLNYEKKGSEIKGCLKILIFKKIKIISRQFPSQDEYHDDEDEEEMRGAQTWYPPYGNMPPANMYPMNMHHPGNSYGDIYAEGTIYTPGAMNKPMGMHGDMSAPVDEHTARMWVQKMDGGEKFKPEQTEQFRMSHCPDCTKWEYYVAVNAMYSDYCETAKKMGMDKPEFYAMLAKDFLKDKDAKPHKLRNYMENVPK